MTFPPWRSGGTIKCKWRIALSHAAQACFCLCRPQLCFAVTHLEVLTCLQVNKEYLKAAGVMSSPALLRHQAHAVAAASGHAWPLHHHQHKRRLHKIYHQPRQVAFLSKPLSDWTLAGEPAWGRELVLGSSTPTPVTCARNLWGSRLFTNESMERFSGLLLHFRSKLRVHPRFGTVDSLSKLALDTGAGPGHLCRGSGASKHWRQVLVVSSNPPALSAGFHSQFWEVCEMFAQTYSVQIGLNCVALGLSHAVAFVPTEGVNLGKVEPFMQVGSLHFHFLEAQALFGHERLHLVSQYKLRLHKDNHRHGPMATMDGQDLYTAFGLWPNLGEVLASLSRLMPAPGAQGVSEVLFLSQHNSRLHPRHDHFIVASELCTCKGFADLTTRGHGANSLSDGPILCTLAWPWKGFEEFAVAPRSRGGHLGLVVHLQILVGQRRGKYGLAHYEQVESLSTSQHRNWLPRAYPHWLLVAACSHGPHFGNQCKPGLWYAFKGPGRLPAGSGVTGLRVPRGPTRGAPAGHQFGFVPPEGPIFAVSPWRVRDQAIADNTGKPILGLTRRPSIAAFMMNFGGMSCGEDDAFCLGRLGPSRKLGLVQFHPTTCCGIPNASPLRCESLPLTCPAAGAKSQTDSAIGMGRQKLGGTGEEGLMPSVIHAWGVVARLLPQDSIALLPRLHPRSVCTVVSRTMRRQEGSGPMPVTALCASHGLSSFSLWGLVALRPWVRRKTMNLPHEEGDYVRVAAFHCLRLVRRGTPAQGTVLIPCHPSLAHCMWAASATDACLRFPVVGEQCFRPCGRLGQVSVSYLIRVIVMGSCRIGEALVPGPSPSATGEPAGEWSLGAINPSGLLFKSDHIRDLPPGIFAISESSLTHAGEHKVRRELKLLSPPRKLLTGHPAPFKTDAKFAIGGKQTGVAFVSSFPCRSIVAGWQPDLYATSRIAAAKFWVRGQWITGGVVYGEAFLANTKPVRAHTETLLQELTGQVVHLTGPRFVAGDFNQEMHHLQEVELWKRQGFIDLQDLACLQWNLAPALRPHARAPRARILYSYPLNCVTYCWQSVSTMRFFRITPFCREAFAP